MIDPLAEIVTLLRPTPTFSKVLSGAGRWRASRTEVGQPFYCVVLEGSFRLSVNGCEPLILQADDFVLVPEVFSFTMTSINPPDDDDVSDIAPAALPDGSFRFGDASVAPEAQWLAGLCAFGSPDAALLVSLLPKLAHVRGEPRLATLVKLVREESRAQRPAREVVLARLLEVLFIEALRATGRGRRPDSSAASPTPVSRSPSVICTRVRTSPGRSHNSQKPPRFHGPLSSIDSAAQSAWHRWSICCRGAWPSPGACCAGTKSASR